MKTMLLLVIAICSSVSFAENVDSTAVKLSYNTQVQITQALLKSEDAQSELFDGLSFAQVIEADLVLQNAGELAEGNSVDLRCTKIDNSTLECNLVSFSKDETGESAVSIYGKIKFVPLSTDVIAFDVDAFAAG